MNRRDFLASGSVTIASLALASTAALEFTGAAGSAASTELKTASPLCRATFAKCIDSVFELHHTVLGAVDLTLSTLLDRPATERNEQFTLIFHAPQQPEDLIRKTLENKKSLSHKAFDAITDAIAPTPKGRSKDEVTAKLNEDQRSQLIEIELNAIAGFTGRTRLRDRLKSRST